METGTVAVGFSLRWVAFGYVSATIETMVAYRSETVAANATFAAVKEGEVSAHPEGCGYIFPRPRYLSHSLKTHPQYCWR